jgi:hypothetical protein
MKIALLLFALLISISVYVFGFVDVMDVRDQIGVEVCEDIAKSSSTRPSSLEVNNALKIRKEVDIRDATVWQTFYSPMTEAQSTVLDWDYEDGRPHLQTTVMMDYSVDSLLGSSRRTLECVFMYDNRRHMLRSFAIDGARVYFTQDAMFMGLSDRLGYQWVVEGVGLTDWVNYVLSEGLF